MASADEPVTFKFYGNRRFYQSGLGGYATHDDLTALARNGFALVVYDAKTGVDITQFILAQGTTEH